MSWLVAGLILWIGAHLLKRAAPNLRARMGKPGKGIVALLILAGLVLMVLGYRVAPITQVYDPPSWARGINNLLMLFAVYLFAVSGAKSRLHRATRHPMLWGTVTWAVAHLMVNGDMASLVLFGGLLIWALMEMAIINLADPAWTPPIPKPRAEVKAVVISVIVYLVIAGIHTWLGYFPFG